MFIFKAPQIDPVAFYVFNWPVRWYGISYIAAFIIAWVCLNKASKYYLNKNPVLNFSISKKQVDDLLTFGILGVIIGARLGHMVFYDFDAMISNPLSIFKTWEGGMAFHGGLLGCILACTFYIKKEKLPFALLADLISLSVPLGIFCVRIANFINQELYGRITLSYLGVIFNNEAVARHPSQLYEAFLEGFLLFVILFYTFLKKLKPQNQGILYANFFIFYGIFRFLSEYVREPSDGVFNVHFLTLTYGQVLTFPMIIIGVILLWAIFKRAK
ncbi:MAG: prolipoprotein diacylglyceryl transferase [Proteobacteria bacterium]|nr:prolipoprotein diacylglyceryl transferase [Pseudomonadota bacterium]